VRRRELLTAATGTLAGGLAGCTFTQPPAGTVVLDNHRGERLGIRLVVDRFGPPGGDCEGTVGRRQVITASVGATRESVLTRLPGPGTYRLTASIQGESTGDARGCLSFGGERRRVLFRVDEAGLRFVGKPGQGEEQEPE
jgi:hypothetical protein